jgi:YbbR domain-containing protein
MRIGFRQIPQPWKNLIPNNMSLRAFIQHNFWLKLFSVLLATLIWYVIHSWIATGAKQPQNPITSNLPTRSVLRLPIRVLTQPGDPRVFKVEPNEVVVSLTGEAAVLREITRENNSAFVDLTNIRSSRETNQQVRVDIPPGIAVEIVPRTVNVEEIIIE